MAKDKIITRPPASKNRNQQAAATTIIFSNDDFLLQKKLESATEGMQKGWRLKIGTELKDQEYWKQIPPCASAAFSYVPAACSCGRSCTGLVRGRARFCGRVVRSGQ
jgi:hypothetical protein